MQRTKETLEMGEASMYLRGSLRKNLGRPGGVCGTLLVHPLDTIRTRRFEYLFMFTLVDLCCFNLRRAIVPGCFVGVFRTWVSSNSQV